MKKEGLFTIALLMIFILTQQLSAQTTIYMEKSGNVNVVPCTVNGLKLKFFFDTGASDVQISLTEAIFMLKNDYLKETDIIGISYSQLANGEITENTKIILREIEFAGFKFQNVEASVVHQLSAPLLLGQSVISKLGKIQLDPATNSLTIINFNNTSINSTSYYIDFASFYNPSNENVYVLIPSNLRSSPDDNSKSLAFIDPFTYWPQKIKIVEKSTNNYYKVTYKGKTGYLHINQIFADFTH